MHLRFLSLALFMTIFMTAGCGGGGSSTPTPTATQPTTARIVLSSQGTLPANALIGGIDLTLVLPSGVSIKSTGTNSEVSSTALAASGKAQSALIIGSYTPSTASTPGKIKISMVNATGFTTGEFATLTCDIAPGFTPTATGFSITGFTAIDYNGANISTLTPTFTAEIK